jgi:hypothetical protein
VFRDDCGNKNMTDVFRNTQVRNEIAVLKKVSLGHQNILTLVDYFETMNNCVFRSVSLLHDRSNRDPH